MPNADEGKTESAESRLSDTSYQDINTIQDGEFNIITAV
jgi:hypothetical protein